MNSIEVGIWALLGTLVALAIKGLIDVVGNRMKHFRGDGAPPHSYALAIEDAASQKVWLERLTLYKRFNSCAHALAEDLRNGRSYQQNRDRLSQLYRQLAADTVPDVAESAQAMRLACIKMIFQGVDEKFDQEFHEASHVFQQACRAAEKSAPPVIAGQQVHGERVAQAHSDCAINSHEQA